LSGYPNKACGKCPGVGRTAAMATWSGSAVDCGPGLAKPAAVLPRPFPRRFNGLAPPLSRWSRDSARGEVF